MDLLLYQNQNITGGIKVKLQLIWDDQEEEKTTHMKTLICKRCGGQEDEIHIFLKCSFANRVWDLIPVSSKS